MQLARRAVEMLRLERQADGSLQLSTMVYGHTKEAAAVKIQSALRRILGKQRSAKRKLDNNAAKIQSCHRGNVGRAKYLLRKRFVSARLIQAFLRGSLAREHVNKMKTLKEIEHELEMKAEFWCVHHPSANLL